MDLQTLWFAAVAVLWTGFLLLEGFDFGVAALLPVLGRRRADRHLMLRSIGPVWDGNEVWLSTATGAVFAAFPGWYATWLPALYLPFVVVLVGLIVRAVAFEWRPSPPSPPLGRPLAAGAVPARRGGAGRPDRAGGGLRVAAQLARPALGRHLDPRHHRRLAGGRGRHRRGARRPHPPPAPRRPRPPPRSA